MLNKTKTTEDGFGSKQSSTSFIWHSWAKKYEAILYIFIKKLDACVYLSTDHTQILSMTKDLNTKPPIFFLNLQVEWIQIKQFKMSIFNSESVEIQIFFLHRISILNNKHIVCTIT